MNLDNRRQKTKRGEITMQKEQMQGEVERFIHPKGYGFIRAGDKSYFFHQTDIVEANGVRFLDQGDIALFFTEKGKNGTGRAVEVIPLLTYKMLRREAAKKGLKMIKARDELGCPKWHLKKRETGEIITEKPLSLTDVAAIVGCRRGEDKTE